MTFHLADDVGDVLAAALGEAFQVGVDLSGASPVAA
jgi:hypothetical protein